MGMLGKWHWILDLFSHFRIQYIATLLCAGAALFLLKQYRWGFISCISGIALSISLIPYTSKNTPKTSTHPEYRLLSYNLNTANENYDKVREFIATTDADIVFLMEINRTWVNELSLLESHYPHFIYHPREDNFGLALYSKHPIENESIRRFGSTGIPSVQTDIRISSDHTVNFIGTHPLPPVNKENSSYRNQQLYRAADHIRKTPHDFQLVAGDLNCTPWSFIFKDFTEQSGLTDSSIGNGIGGTWFRKLGFISIPIDHVLGNAGIVFTKKEIKDTFGSDHNAVLVTFRLHLEQD